MTAEILKALLAANLAAGGAILAVLAIRGHARRLFGARLAYRLWLAAPLAALAVFAPKPAILAPLPAVPVRVVAGEAMDMLAPIHTSAVAIASAGAPAFDFPSLIAGLWLTGAAAMLALSLFAHRRGVASFGVLTREAQSPRRLRSARTGLGPALIGAFVPRLVLPADFETRFAAREQVLILAHEHRHMTAGDTRINSLITLAACLNWFNPLVHIATHYARVDQEMACDAAVLARFPGERRTYAEALLKTQASAIPLPLGCYWPGRTANLLKERVEMLSFKSPSRLRRIAGGGAVAALSLGAGLAAWAASPPAAPAPTVPTQGAVSAALGAAPAPVVGKIAAPPATVEAGSAAPTQPSPGGEDPDLTAAMKVAADHGMLDTLMARPALADLAKTNPKLAALRLTRNVWTSVITDHAPVSWRTGPVAKIPGRLSGQLVDGDGHAYAIETFGLDLNVLAVSGMAANADVDDGTWFHGMRRVTQDGDNLTVRSTYVLDSGEILDAPDLVVPLGGQPRTVPLPGGGSLTLAVVNTPPP